METPAKFIKGVDIAHKGVSLVSKHTSLTGAQFDRFAIGGSNVEAASDCASPVFI